MANCDLYKKKLFETTNYCIVIIATHYSRWRHLSKCHIVIRMVRIRPTKISYAIISYIL